MDTSSRSVYAGLPRNEFTECKLGELQDKVWIYFQRKNISHGCDVDSVSRVDSGTSDKIWMKVTFSDPSGVQHVLSKARHELRVEGCGTVPLEIRECLQSDVQLHESEDSEDSFVILNAGDLDKGTLDGENPGEHLSALDSDHSSNAGVQLVNQQSSSSRDTANPISIPEAALPYTEKVHTLKPLITAIFQALSDGQVSTHLTPSPARILSSQSHGDETPHGEMSVGAATDDEEDDLYSPDSSIQSAATETPNLMKILRSKPTDDAESGDARKGSDFQDKGPFQQQTNEPVGSRPGYPEKTVGIHQQQSVGGSVDRGGSSQRPDARGAVLDGRCQQDRGGQVLQERNKSANGQVLAKAATTKNRSCSETSPEEKHTAEERNEYSEVSLKRPAWEQQEDSSDEEKEQEGKVQKEDQEEEQFVEVTGFNPSSEEMLKMYFENFRRSGGGDIKTWEHDPKAETVRMTFEDPSLTDNVIARQHKVGGKNLTLRFKKSRPRPVKKRCLLLKGIPDGCTSEFLTMFIENECGTEDFKIQYGEMPGTALCTFNEDIPDMDKVIRRISSKTIKGVYMTAEKMHESGGILVQGVSPKVSLEVIELYFGNKSKSGGNDVREVQPGPMHTQATVYFEDWKVVGDVLAKRGPHKVGGVELSVEEYHECLGRLSPFDVSTPHTPMPVTVQVPQPVMEFIFGQKGQHAKETLLQKLSDVKATLKWPDGDDKTTARLKPLFEDGQWQSSWLKWPEVAPEVLTDFLNRFKSTRIPIPPPLWKETVARIDQVDTKGLSIEPNNTQHIVHLVGEQQDVAKRVNVIGEIVKELRTTAEYKVKQENEIKQEIFFTPDKFQHFVVCGIKDEIENRFLPNLKITVTTSEDKRRLTFQGTQKNVQEAELLTRRKIDSLEHVKFKASSNKTQFVNSLKDKIHEILRSQGIRAACMGSDDSTIIVYAATKEDASQAKAYIDQEIVEDFIPITGQAASDVLRSSNGRMLLDGINNQKFIMAAFSDSTGKVLQLVGFKTNMDKTKQKITIFLKDNIIMTKIIPANKMKIQLITIFHGADMVNVEKQFARNQVKIQPQMRGQNKGIVIQGNEEGLEAASQFIASLIARIKEQLYPVSRTGMAQLFREDKGRKFLESLEMKFECVISENVEEGSDEEEEAQAGRETRPLMTSEILCQITLPNSFTLKVCRGDLTMQKVDCIVNAANVKLKHGGGLAADIVEAGGTVIQTECEQILKNKHHRQLHVGEAVCTSSGSLPCKKVIHVAGPQWPHDKTAIPRADDEPTQEEVLLYDSIIECLKLANQNKMQSIAIPAISAGIFGFPVELVARQILNAAADFCQNMRNLTLTEIHFTNNDQPTCNVFRQAVMDRFGPFQGREAATGVRQGPTATTFSPPVMEDDTPVSAPAPKFTASGQNSLTTNEGITITLKKGSITNEMVDVIVNTAGPDMNLSSGKVSQALLKAAGSALQKECDTVITTRGKVRRGDFIETGPGALTCKKIYHCVCEGYRQGESEKVLKKLILKLMEQAEQNEMLSIAIPALGTGNLNYPAGVTAQVMYESILEFSNLHPNGLLKDVRFVVYDKDAKTIQGFEDKIQRLSTPGTSAGATGYAPSGLRRKLRKSGSASTPSDRQPESYSEIVRDQTGMLQTKIGSVCLQVGPGDLRTETTDAIVKSVGPATYQQAPIYVQTGVSSLQCSGIFHVVTPKSPEAMKTAVHKVLKLAEETKLKSVSFPAIGTGQGGLSVADSASAMLAAVGEFAVQKKPRHLHLIRLVIFQPRMVTGFQDALKKEVGTSYKKQKGLVSKGIGLAKSALYTAWYGGSTAADDQTEKGSLEETIILNICAMDMASIKKAVDKIEQFQSEEYTSEDKLDDMEMLDKMTDKNHTEFKDIEAKYSVKITYPIKRGGDKFVRVEGRVINVKDALIAIQDVFKKMHKDLLQAQQMELLSKEVQWKYSTPQGEEAYDPELNAIIEKAYKNKQPSVALDLEDGKVTINFQNMEESSRAGTLQVRRTNLSKVAAFEMPPNWIPMRDNDHFKMAPLAAGTSEYIAVERHLQTTSAVQQIQEIQRIQNKELLMQYKTLKAAMEARLGRPDIEKTLYHGTDEKTSDKINKQGFNRSFCGKKATDYGNGTYFAVKADYSAQDKYSNPNANGVKHMYLAKVLVGDYVRGSQGMITPPNKPSHPDQQYDSVVDNIYQPGIFVIFHDAQAYPEFLIKFK
ncbi:poly [ADP-ribose] polymerase 14-like isoform X2 [Acanthaster planci]|uniref:Poly [ADP-ribose] polymerase n=1 Tax=Acanthaster planci TaxID=133434 RepID=A0A8B7YJI0_ACAPL|nr:poly [ADP-ribose] polymerase 14-like isoform X2 [Acanthaster planci]